MRRVRRRDTKAELLVRQAAHRRGLRYFVDRRPIPQVRSRADLVFPRIRVAVFVDGCFWHSCPIHGTTPATNADWWVAKLAGNVERDRRNDAALRAADWTVLRFWEHEDPDEVADRIEQAVRDFRR